ncbi:hypothetical protein AKJ16_DCAP04923 [Drosera capensis]
MGLTAMQGPLYLFAARLLLVLLMPIPFMALYVKLRVRDDKLPGSSSWLRPHGSASTRRTLL